MGAMRLTMLLLMTAAPQVVGSITIGSQEVWSQFPWSNG